MSMRRNPTVSFALLTLIASLAASSAQAGELTVDVGRGPVTVFLPSSYDPEVPTPLLLLLHGYSGTGAGQEAYMRFKPVADDRGVIYAHPDGTRDFFGLQFWNATDACCDFFNTNVDDSGYLLDLIDEIKSVTNVDDNRVYLTGHSNGGFMSYRMACDHSETIAAIAGLAGATWEDPADCSPTEPVHILQIHGTADDTILFDGVCNFFQCYPGAIESVVQWADFNDCDPVVDTSAPNLNLDFFLPGDETLTAEVATGCAPDGSASLWAIVDGTHSPALTSDYAEEVVDFLLAHGKTP